jgi:DNA-binding transcriptional regulator YiaG
MLDAEMTGNPHRIGFRPGDDYSERIKRMRSGLGLTQQTLADRLGVSFATVNRWENGQTTPSQLSWNQLRQLEISIAVEAALYDKADR